MEVRILKYTGPLEEGTVIVRQEKPLSPFRKLRVYQGVQWEVGKDMPEKTAKNIIDMMGHSFKVEVIQLDNNGEILHNVKDFLKGYKEMLGKDAVTTLPALTVEALLTVIGEDAVIAIKSALENSSQISPQAREKFGITAQVEVVAEVEKAESKAPAEPEKTGEEVGAKEEAEDGGTDGNDNTEEDQASAPKRAAPKAKPPQRKK